MNAEQIESELNNHSGEFVTVVRPGFGGQSDSWVGYLSVTHRDIPMIFQVQSETSTTIFKSDDVTEVEDITDHEQSGAPTLLIRLKGPLDYRGQLVTA